MDNYRPPVGFHFKVDFSEVSGDQNRESTFQEVTGLSFSLETKTHKEGGQNKFTHHLPAHASYDPLVLRRGLLCGSEVFNWVEDARKFNFFKPVTIKISLCDETGNPLITWTVFHAYPVKWSISGMNAEQNGLAIETLELKYLYFDQSYVQ